MQKNFTPTTHAKTGTTSRAHDRLNPSRETLRYIMQFAAVYRSEALIEGHFSEFCLN